jgi:CAAX protease family protein
MTESEEGPAAAVKPVREPPGLARAIGLCLIFYAFTIPAEIVGHALGLDPLTRVLVDQLFAWPPTLFLAWGTTRRSWSDTFLVRRFPARVVLPSVIALAGVSILAQEVAGWIPTPEWARRFMESYEAGSAWTTVAVGVVIAPVAEEHLFRGWMLRGFLFRQTRGGAIAMTALLFGIFHGNPWQGVVAFAAGLVLGWLVVRTGSVLPAIIGHAAMNATPFALDRILPRLGGEKLGDMDHLPPWLIGLGLVLAIAGGVMLRRALPPVPTEVADRSASDA